jgi:integrase/recombinase XerD
MLTLYRRHRAKCKLKSRKAKCSCPIWAQGTLHGEAIRKSLDLTNWEAAQKLVRDWEVRGMRSVVSIEDAFDRFIGQFEANKAAEATIGKYRLLKRDMVAFFGDRAVHTLSVDDVAKFRETFKGANITVRMKIARLRSFFRFAIDREWMEKNPAKALKLPKEVEIERKPYEPDELAKIEKAIAKFPAWGIYGEGNRLRLRAFISVLRWSGLRIGDVVQLDRAKLKDGHITLRTAKNGKRVMIPVHPEIENAIEEMKPQGEYFFWSGEGKPKSAVSDWQRTLLRLSKIAKIKITAHRFRHTLAVELLSKGISVSEVAAILGNTPRIVERSYSHWIAQRQDALNEAVKATWVP